MQLLYKKLQVWIALFNCVPLMFTLSFLYFLFDTYEDTTEMRARV